MKLSLSDAIRLGSLLIPEPRAFETAACALGMALLANGITPSGDAEPDQQAVLQLYPWIAQGDTCEWCGEWMPYEAMIYHPFDQHVMAGELSLERFCDWISWTEPPPAMDSEGEAGEKSPLLWIRWKARKGTIFGKPWWISRGNAARE